MIFSITNSSLIFSLLGNAKVKLENKGDLSFFAKQDETVRFIYLKVKKIILFSRMKGLVSKESVIVHQLGRKTWKFGMKWVYDLKEDQTRPWLHSMQYWLGHAITVLQVAWGIH